jgi:hypothetical protein
MNPIRVWNRFLFGPVSARPLGVFRIVFGLLMMIYLAIMAVEFDHWYTGAGLLQGTEAREAAGPYRLSPLQYVQDTTTPRLFLVVTFAAALGLTLGWRTRLMSILLYLSLLSLYHRNVSSNGGPDAVPMILSFYLMLCPSGAAYSLDAIRQAKRRGAPAEPLILPWTLRLLQIQFCLIYFQSCVIKCGGGTWMNGTALHYVLFNREFDQFNLEWLAGYPLIINALTHSALLIEFALAFWLWFRPTRRWAILCGVLLHAGIRPVLLIPGFGELMIATYLVFLDPDEVDRLLHVLDPRAGLARLGVRWPSFGFLPGAVERPIGLAGWQQLEFGFDRAEASPGAEPIAAS